MNLKAGIFLKGTNDLQGTYFENLIIFITEHNEKGAMGFVINNIFSRSFNELAEFSYSSYFPMYEGGPVDQEHLYFIHQRPDLIENGEAVGDGIYLGGDLLQAVGAVNDGSLNSDHLKIFVGYCGWDKDELEAEIEEGSWEIIHASKQDLFKAQ